jgi:hypothetical protein
MSSFQIGQIVFSVSSPFFHLRAEADNSVVIQALKANGISFVALDKGGKQAGDMVEQFHKDESITVFLLHAERERYVLTCCEWLVLI